MLIYSLASIKINKSEKYEYTFIFLMHNTMLNGFIDVYIVLKCNIKSVYGFVII